MEHNHKKIRNICVIRLSSLGDICHMLPFIKNIKNKYPESTLYWIIGKTEYELVRNIPNVKFIVFDKSKINSYFQVYTELKKINFDYLYLLQVSLRACLISLLVNKKTTVGFNRSKSTRFYSFFIDYISKDDNKNHVVDTFLNLLSIDSKDIKFKYEWNLNISKDQYNEKIKQFDIKKTYFLINPSSRSVDRNWQSAKYANIADHVIKKYKVNCIFVGDSSHSTGLFIEDILSKMSSKALNLAGKTKLFDLAALISNSKFLISPDSGPIHIATCTNTKVIGLYAVTNTVRAGPYNSIDYCIDKYNLALKLFYKMNYEDAKWRHKNKKKGVMDLISLEEVKFSINKLLRDLK